jgi:uncharacterized protein (TIGR02266 family)
MLRKKLIRRFEGQFKFPTPRPPLPDKSVSAAAKKADVNERAAPRLETRLVASVEVDAVCHVGFTENLSEGGAFLATRAPQNVGEQVSLIIALPDLALVRARGTVRWVRKPSKTNGMSAGMGIRFERLTPLDAVRIQDFVATRRSMLFDDTTGVRPRQL